MMGRKFRLGVAVATLALGAGLGSSTAVASTGTAQHVAAPTISQTVVVLSDTINFTAVATPSTTGTAGSYTLTSNQCSLTSDGENIVFPCTITLQFNLATLSGTGRVTSADGVVQFAYTLTPTGSGSYTLTGNCATSANLCYEIDSDTGATVQYPANVSGTLTITPIPGTPNLKVTGNISVYESPTAP
jgi:hypothetical protein